MVDLANLKYMTLSDESLVRAHDSVISSLPSLVSIVGLSSVSGITRNPSNYGKMTFKGILNVPWFIDRYACIGDNKFTRKGFVRE